MCRFSKYLEVKRVCLWNVAGQIILQAGAPCTGQMLMSAVCFSESNASVLFWISRKFNTFLLNVRQAAKCSSLEVAVIIWFTARGISVVRKCWNLELGWICIGENSIRETFGFGSLFVSWWCCKLGWSLRLVSCPGRAAYRWTYGLRGGLEQFYGLQGESNTVL